MTTNTTLVMAKLELALSACLMHTGKLPRSKQQNTLQLQQKQQLVISDWKVDSIAFSLNTFVYYFQN